MKSLFFVFVMLSYCMLSAQESGNGFQLAGGFGGPFFGWSTIDGEMSLMTGGEGAGVFKNNIFIGGFGSETSDNHTPTSDVENNEKYYLQREYGGFWIGYIYRKPKLIDISLSLKTGFGKVKLNNTDNQVLLYDESWLISPVIEFEKRFFQISKVSLGLSYDFYQGVSLLNYENKDFSGLHTYLSFKFGWF